jgi:hypothetical protein
VSWRLANLFQQRGMSFANIVLNNGISKRNANFLGYLAPAPSRFLSPAALFFLFGRCLCVPVLSLHPYNIIRRRNIRSLDFVN